MTRPNPDSSPPQALGEGLLEAARRNPDALHLQTVASDGAVARWTYRETLAAARAVAGGLLAAGLQPDQPVAVLGDSTPLQVEVVYGVWLAGGVLVPLDPQWSVEAHARALAKARVRFGVSLAGRHEPLAEAARGRDGFVQLHAENLRARADAGVTLPRVDPETRALILFTSGTTGEPKAAVLRHRALGWNARTVLNLIDAGPADNFLNVLPLHHSFGLMVTVIAPPMRGAHVTFPPSLKGPDIARTMRETGITVVAAVPQLMLGFDRGIRTRLNAAGWLERAAFRVLLALSARLRDRGINLGPRLFRSVHQHLGPKLRYMGSAGAAMDPEVGARLRAIGLHLVEGYGLTEAGPAIAFDQGDRPRYGSVGFPLPGVEVRIDKPNADGIGEIVARSPSLFDGYLDAPEATAEMLRDGWLYTGDLGRFDADGRLYITGRSKEVIVLGSGKNIYPHEVEVRLDESRFVAESCVLGLRENDRPGTEKLHAVVVPDFDALRAAGISRIEVTLSDEIVAVGDKLPSHHRINGITVRATPLPRTALGKLKRFKVYEELMADRAGRPIKVAVAEPAPDSEHWPAVEGALRKISSQEGVIAASTGLELDLGLDSLGRVEALAELEERLGTKLPVGFGAEALTAGEVLVAVDAFMAAGGVAVTVPTSGGISEATRRDLRSWKRRVARPIGLAALGAVYWPTWLLARLLVQFEVNGREHLPSGPCIISPNHGSYLDAAVMQFAIPFRKLVDTWALGDNDIFGHPLLRLVSIAGNVVRLDAGAGLRATLDKGGAILGMGLPLLLFPEGTRAPVGERLPFRRGAAMLARSENVPIVPTWLEGVDELMPRGTLKLKFGHRVAVRFGPPIDPRIVDGERDPAQALTDLLRQRIDDLRIEDQREAKKRAVAD